MNALIGPSMSLKPDPPPWIEAEAKTTQVLAFQKKAGGRLALSLGDIKPICHDRHKTVPEFIVILCDQMWMTIT